MNNIVEKCCTICKKIKLKCEFGSCGHGGLASRCRKCKAIQDREYRLKRGEELKAKKRETYHKKPGEKQKYIDNATRWRKANPEKARECVKASVKKKRSYYTKKTNLYIRNRTKVDPLFRIRIQFGKRLAEILKEKNLKKNTKFSQYLGCTLDEFKIHLESKFQEGMTWENYGLFGWHIDHIKPLASATTEEEIYKLNHYTNLQPLWAQDNLKKGANYA